MKEQLKSVKFNLTEEMTKELIKFNKLKKELISLKQKGELTKEEFIQIKEIQDKLNKTRIRFIKEFRKNNKEEIDKYLELKDQI